MSRAPDADATPVVFLDANVLIPTLLRALLFAVADQGLFAPRWTDRIEAEWRAAAARGPDPVPAALLEADVTRARLRYPTALTEGWRAFEGPLTLPDWDDRHVLAGAIAAQATLILTSNLRDFPPRTLAGHGLAREAPDPFLWRLAGAEPTRMAAAVAAFAAQLPPPLADEPLPRLLKRARLPRFAKVLVDLSG